MKYEVKFTSQFKRNLKLAQKQHKDISALMEVIEKLANGDNYKGCRECHIVPDWLLVYEYIER